MTTSVENYKKAHDVYLRISKMGTKDKILKQMKERFADLSEAEIEQICASSDNKTIKDTTVFVGADDFNKKYVVYANRDIDYDRAKKFKFEGILTSVVHLLEIGQNQYRILDGQHRLYRICSEAKETNEKYKIKAVIYPICHFDSELAICNKIGEINEQRVQSKGDTLAIYKHESEWFKTAEVLGIQNNFTFNSSRNSITWINVIKSYAIMKASIKSKELKYVHSVKNSIGLKNIWLQETRENVREYLQFLNWYYPYAMNAIKNYNISAFCSTDVIAIVGAIYFDNKDADLDFYMKRLFDNPKLVQIRNRMRFEDLSKFILELMNYRLTKHVIDLFGEDGRETKE